MVNASRCHRRWLAGAAALVLLALPAAAQVPPLGPDFVVCPTDDGHVGPWVAVNPYGQFLVGVAFNFGGALIVAYDRDGEVLGTHNDVQVPVLGDRPMHIAPGTGDGFVAAFESWNGGVEAVRLDRTGATVGVPFAVSPTGDAITPRVATTSGGDLVVVWTDFTSDGGDTSGTSIQARWFAPDGTPLSDRWQVNTTTAGDQAYPDLATSGDWIAIVWHSPSSSGSDQSGSSIQLRVVAADGAWVGNEAQVNTHSPLDQTYPDVALGENGDLVVTWQSQTSGGDDADGSSVQARRLPFVGPPGDEVQVNTYTVGDQVRPAVGIMDGDAFEVFWTSEGSPGDPDQWSVERRPFAPDGTPAGDQSSVSTGPVLGTLPADAAMNHNGDAVASWNASAPEVRARIFRTTLFVDGFETGSISQWSSAQP